MTTFDLVRISGAVAPDGRPYWLIYANTPDARVSVAWARFKLDGLDFVARYRSGQRGAVLAAKRAAMIQGVTLA